jgi:hypothetical protein
MVHELDALALVASQNLVHAKTHHPDSRVIAVSVRPELQTVGFAPQWRSADDCWALAGDHQILRRAEALGAAQLSRAARTAD